MQSSIGRGSPLNRAFAGQFWCRSNYCPGLLVEFRLLSPRTPPPAPPPPLTVRASPLFNSLSCWPSFPTLTRESDDFCFCRLVMCLSFSLWLVVFCRGDDAILRHLRVVSEREM